MTIGERIKQLRIDREMTQSELGEIIGVGKATIQKYETNQIQNLKTSHIKTLCSLFDKRPHYFIYDDDVINFNEIDDQQLFNHVEMLFGKTVRRILIDAAHLNNIGQTKTTEYLSDLLKIPEYTLNGSRSVQDKTSS